MKTYLLKLPDDIHKEIKVISAEADMTMQDFINRILKDFLNSAKQNLKEP